MVGRLITLGKEAGLKGLFAGLGPRMSEPILPKYYLDTVVSVHGVCADIPSHDRRSRQLSIHHVRLYQAGFGCSSRYRNPQRVDGMDYHDTLE